MSYFEQTKITDSNDIVINPATEESILLLRRMVKLLESNAVVDIANRQKITIDSMTTGALPSIGVSTPGLDSGANTPTTNRPTANAPVSAPNAVYWQPVWIGPVDQRFQVIDAARNTYANSIRNNLTFS
ncbi:MAG: hypothetical protein WCQ49_02380 [Candidatus Saccharibacteria bacterium]